MKSFQYIALLSLSVLVIAGCGAKDDAPVTATDTSVDLSEMAEYKPNFPVREFDGTIREALETETDYRMLWTAIRASKLRSALADDKEFTIFAPSNAAFGQISSTELQGMLTDAESLRPILEAHILPYEYHPNSIRSEKVSALNGKVLNVVAGETYEVEGLAIKEAISTSNGHIYLIHDIMFHEPKKNN